MAAFDALDADERGYWVAEWELERLTCSDCGNPVEECSDPKRIWYPYRRICRASMERAAAEAAYNDLHEDRGFHDGTFTRWNSKRTPEFPVAAGDGVSFGVTDYDRTPWDHFTTDENASPVKPTDDIEGGSP